MTERKLPPLPLNIASFSKLRKGGYVYVDKTEQIKRLVQQGENYFLSRPRRFGKSLLLTTLRSLFEGQRDLFKGLWIDQAGRWEWIRHPVIYLDFSSFKHQSAEFLSDSILKRLYKIAQDYQISLVADNRNECSLLIELVEKLAERAPVVILVDEYDAPIIGNLAHPAQLAEIRQFLGNFFATIKSVGDQLCFSFFTGVSKFSRVSVFSGLNSLEDISEAAIAEDLLGYTEKELLEYFPAYFENLAEKEKTTVAEVRNSLRRWYNGYRFSSSSTTTVYNPYSVISCLKFGNFDNYWFSSATPTFLLTLIKNRPESILIEEQGLPVDQDALASFEPENIPVRVSLLQTGYLTIKSYDAAKRILYLDYPNLEVKMSFERHLLALLGGVAVEQISPLAEELATSLQKLDWERFKRTIISLIAHIPYTLRELQEKHLHALLQIAFSVAGFHTESEFLTNQGRIDLIVRYQNSIFIFEFKLNASAQRALDQIIDRGYGERFMIEKKNIYAVGINFSAQNERLEVSYQVQEL